MPKYAPLITSEAWKWHVRLEEAVRKGLMTKEPDNFTLSGWCYVPVLSQPGKTRLLAKESECDEAVD